MWATLKGSVFALAELIAPLTIERYLLYKDEFYLFRIYNDSFLKFSHDTAEAAAGKR